MLHFVRREMMEFSTSLSRGHVAIINTYIWESGGGGGGRGGSGTSQSPSSSFVHQMYCRLKQTPSRVSAQEVDVFVFHAKQPDVFGQAFIYFSACLCPNSLDRLRLQTVKRTKQTNPGQCYWSLGSKELACVPECTISH